MWYSNYHALIGDEGVTGELSLILRGNRILCTYWGSFSPKGKTCAVWGRGAPADIAKALVKGRGRFRHEMPKTVNILTGWQPSRGYVLPQRGPSPDRGSSAVSPLPYFIFTKIPLGERPEAYLYGSYGA